MNLVAWGNGILGVNPEMHFSKFNVLRNHLEILKILVQ